MWLCLIEDSSEAETCLQLAEKQTNEQAKMFESKYKRRREKSLGKWHNLKKWYSKVISIRVLYRYFDKEEGGIDFLGCSPTELYRKIN